MYSWVFSLDKFTFCCIAYELSYWFRVYMDMRFLISLAGSLRESSENYISLEAIHSSGLEPVLDYIYGGLLYISSENIESILATSSYLQVMSVLKNCQDFIKQGLTLANCLQYSEFMRVYALYTLIPCSSSDSVLEYVDDFIRAHLSDLYFLNEHVKLPYEHLKKYLTSDNMNISELTLYNIVRCWLQADPDRQQHCLELMKCIRFTLISMPDLQELLKSSFVCDDLDVKCMVEDALKYLSLNMTERMKIESPKDQVRGGLWLCVFGGFDKNRQPENYSHRFQVLSTNIKLKPIPDEDTWIEMPELPQHFFGSSAVSARGLIFVCGGWEGLSIADIPAIATCHVLDPVTWHWSKMASLKFPRAEFSLVVHCGDLYAIEGWCSRSFHADPIVKAIERYSWNEDCWRVVTQITHPFHSAECAASLSEHIYMYGSLCIDHDDSMVATLRCFNSKYDSWEELPFHDDNDWENGPYKMVTVQDCICITKFGNRYIRTYKPSTRQWHKFEVFSFDQNKFFTAISVQDKIYFLGNRDKYGSYNGCSSCVPNVSPEQHGVLPLPLPSFHRDLTSHPLCTAVAIPYHHIKSATHK